MIIPCIPIFRLGYWGKCAFSFGGGGVGGEFKAKFICNVPPGRVSIFVALKSNEGSEEVSAPRLRETLQTQRARSKPSYF